MLSKTTGSTRSSNEEERQHNIRSASDAKNEANNPCKKELELSYKCLNDTGFDREKCTVYFHNYNTCKEFWNRVKADRRSRGLLPYIPFPEDRDAIKAEYFKKWNMHFQGKDKS